MAEIGISLGKRSSAATVAAIPFWVAAFVYALLLSLGNRLLADPDSYWHITSGQWMLSHHQVPTADPFSFTMRGAHWISFEWLSQLAYAGAFALGGWNGVVVLASAAIAAAFGLLAYFLLRQLAPQGMLILILAALVLASPHMLARPHALALPVMVAWAGILVGRLDRGDGPPYAALPLMLLWANLHGSFALGLALIAPVAAEAVLAVRPKRRNEVAARWAFFAVLAFTAACVTPYGPGMFAAIYRTLMLGNALSIIGEWRPQNFGHPAPFELLFLFGIGLALYRGVKLPPIRILVLLGLLHLALSQARHADALAMLAPIFLAAPLAVHAPARAKISAETKLDLPAAALAVVLAGIFTLLGMSLHSNAPDPRNTPQAAIAASDIAHAGPVLNDYAFGGYLIYAGIPPFIDGRGEIYGADFILRHHRAVTLQDLPDFVRLLDEYRIRSTLLAPGTPAVALLDRLPGWRRVYADNIAVVHRRITAH